MQDAPSPSLQACTGMDIAADALARAAGKLTAAAQSRTIHATQTPGQVAPTSEGMTEEAGGGSPSEPGPSSAGNAACDSTHARQQHQQQSPASLWPAADPLSGSRRQEGEQAAIAHALPGMHIADAQQPEAAALPTGCRLIGGPPNAAHGPSITLLQGNICAPELQLPGVCPVGSAWKPMAACCACLAVWMAVLLPPVAVTWRCNILAYRIIPSGTCVATAMRQTGLERHQFADQDQGLMLSYSLQYWR